MRYTQLSYPVAVFLALVLCSTLQAQDTLHTYNLMDVVIEASREESGSRGLRNDEPDSLMLAQSDQASLATVLNRSGIQIKSYGNGALASIAIRGANATQTSLIWNGINLQSSTYGQSDFSLLPAFLFDRVSIQPGSTTANWGSGAIGGAVLLQTDQPKENLHIRAGALNGSFGENGQGLLLSGRHKNLSGSIRGVRQRVVNNFPYQDNLSPGAQGSEKQLQHAGFFQQATMGDVWWQPKPTLGFSAHIWLQDAIRDIPPTLVQSFSNAVQTDRVARVLLKSTVVPGGYQQHRITTRIAFLNDKLVYENGFSETDSTRVNTLIAETEWRYITPRYTLFAGVNNTWQQAEVTGYIPLRQLNRTALFALMDIIFQQNFRLAIQARAEQVAGNLIQPVGSIGIDWKPLQWIRILGNISRNYRLPTFNDLYWNPGGNPLLRPEKSWNQECTIEAKQAIKNVEIRYGITGFNRQVTDWILWAPLNALWTPQNILQVWSRGFEHRFNVEYAIGKWQIAIQANYDYVRATSQKPISPNDQSIGKQLIYVPAHRAMGLLTIRYGAWGVSYGHQYTAHRFTSSDHRTYLPEYDEAIATVFTQLKIKSISNQPALVDVFIRINNCWDERYQSVAFRPMPGRSFQVGMRIDLQITKRLLNSTIQQSNQ